MLKIYETKSWTQLREQVLNSKECKCHLCGKKRWQWMKRKKEWRRAVKMHLHHLSYNNVGNETEADVVTLCPSCHQLFHQIDRRVNVEGFIADLKKVVYQYLPGIRV